jgi:hypothetical protein
VASAAVSWTAGRGRRCCGSWFVLFQAGLRYNEKAIDPGAQTERRGEAGPVRLLLSGEDSPAFLFIDN